MVKVPGSEFEEWIGELKPYQKNALNQMLDEMEPEEAAKTWLSSTGPSSVVDFGGTRNPEPFWDRFKKEFRKFLCDEDAYVEAKKKLGSEQPVARGVLIQTMSVGIATEIGTTAALLAPATATLLASVAQMGVNAYCEG